MCKMKLMKDEYGYDYKDISEMDSELLDEMERMYEEEIDKMAEYYGMV